jgi:adenine phosphoribosyltransferase
MNLKELIRDVPDFPKKGIIFKDITTLLARPDATKEAVRQIVEKYRAKGVQKVVCIEARGFILGSIIAQELQAGFVPIRKKGKLPSRTLHEEYDLEYGTDLIEIHSDAISQGERVLLHDDLLATGGTMGAAIRLVQKLGALIIGASFVIELDFLNGRKNIAPVDTFSLIHYSTE